MSLEGRDAWEQRHSVKTKATKISSSSSSSASSDWITEVLGTSVSDDIVLVFCNILAQEDLNSRELLASVSRVEFQECIVDKYLNDFKSLGMKKMFEMLHCKVTSDTSYSTVPVSNNDGAENSAAYFAGNQEKMAKMEERMLEMQQQLRNVNHTDVASAKEVMKMKNTMDAVFQSSFVGKDNQVQEAVATREGATIRVVNPQADLRMDVTDGVVLEMQDMLSEMEQKMRDLESRLDEGNKTKQKSKRR